VALLLESAVLGAEEPDAAGEEFCARAADAVAKSQMIDESASPIIVFMSPSQKSIIVQRPEAVKAIRGAPSSR